MIHTDIGNLIRAHIAGISIVSDGTLKMQYDNQTFRPEDGTYWGRVSIREGESTAVTLGASVSRTVGVVIIQLFAPLDQGDGLIRSYVDTIKAAMRAIDISGIWFRIPSVNTIGRRNSWWQVNIACPFTVDDQP